MRRFVTLENKVKIAVLGVVLVAFGGDAVVRDATATSDQNIGVVNSAVSEILNGEFSNAIATLTNLIEADGASLSDDQLATVHYNLGYAHQLNGQTEAAIDDYDTAISIASDDASAYYNRGIARESLAQFGRAIEDYSAAIALEPANSLPLYNRANLLLEMGDVDLAVADFSNLVKLDPENSDYVIALRSALGAMEFAAETTLVASATPTPKSHVDPQSSAMAFEMFEWDNEDLPPYVVAADQAAEDECGGISFADPDTGKSFLVQSQAQVAGSYCRITQRQQ